MKKYKNFLLNIKIIKMLPKTFGSLQLKALKEAKFGIGKSATKNACGWHGFFCSKKKNREGEDIT